MATNIYTSDLAIHPGEFLQETIEDIGMTQAELAKRLGRPIQAVNEIIKGKKRIEPETALELEDVLGIPSNIWVGLQSEYDMVLARQKEVENMKQEIELSKKFPYLDIAKLGLVKTTRKAIEKVDELKRFFGVAKLGQISHVKTYEPAFRVSQKANISNEAIATWLQAVRITAQQDKIQQSFDRAKLKESLGSLREAVNLENIQDSISTIKKILNDCGIVLVILPHFKNTSINGATFWLGNKAVIAMTLKGAFSDIFWFSFFHEVGHVLLHDKRKVFLENGHNDPDLEKQEQEADAFARDILINEADYKKFVENEEISKESVIVFANQQNIKVSIVVGRLMSEKIIEYNHYIFSKLRDRYKWEY